MDFSTSDEDHEIAELAAAIFGDCSDPDRLRQLEADGKSIDRELWTQLARANLLGVALPEEIGGMGFGLFGLAALLAEQGRHLGRVPLFTSLACAGLAIARFGNAQQQSRYLGPLATGEHVLTAALEELGGGAALRPAALAAPADHGGWRLRGEKVCVPAADVAAAILVTAATPGDSAGAFLIDPNASGVKLEGQTTTHGEPVFALTLEDVAVSAEDALADPIGGSAIAEWIGQRAMIALAWIQLGVSEEALRRTADYTSTRKQFGRPVGSFQAVATRAADGYIDLEALRSVLWQATWLLSEDRPAAREVAVAKWWACRAAHRIGHTAQHLHGGIGADIDYPIHRYFLWSKHLSLSMGGGSEQLARIGEALVSQG